MIQYLLYKVDSKSSQLHSCIFSRVFQTLTISCSKITSFLWKKNGFFLCKALCFFCQVGYNTYQQLSFNPTILLKSYQQDHALPCRALMTLDK